VFNEAFVTHSSPVNHVFHCMITNWPAAATQSKGHYALAGH